MSKCKIYEMVRRATDAHVAIDRLAIAKQTLEGVPGRSYETMIKKLERQQQIELIRFDNAVEEIRKMTCGGK